MQSGRRTGLLLVVLLVAAAIAFEPVIHTHPLTESSNGQCAVCVNAHAQVTTLAPAPMTLLVAVGVVQIAVRTSEPAPPVSLLASRAPPAA